ncbi:LPS translocon maturation chaperone LptM [Pseudoalteromonas sp. SSDWG2]|uniref:LPS translocon maturation chaperone LptM n=1 Tax=Pseudoalteromonas sp. SSDWG2 TaxID=3139391 RepID=UPI003BAB16FC
MYNSYRFRLTLLAASLTLLGACGQSGPLYLPEEAPSNQQQPQTPEQPASAEQPDSQQQIEQR